MIKVIDNTINVHFDKFDLKAYDTFIQSKNLPEYNLSYDYLTDSYTLKTPTRFAHIFGMEAIDIDRGWLPIADYLFDYVQFIVKIALQAKRYAVWADCVHGNTLINTPLGNFRIKDLEQKGEPIEVFSINNKGEVVKSVASCPFKKGIADIYEVTLESGKKILVTGDHVFLSVNSWKKAKDLCVGDSLCVSDEAHLQSISESFPSTSLEDALYLNQKGEDLKEHCSPSSHLYGQQLHREVNSGQESAPSQGDALSLGYLLSYMGDLEHKPKHIHRHQNIYHLSMQDYACQGKNVESVEEYYDEPSHHEHIVLNILTYLRYSLCDTRQGSILESYPCLYQGSMDVVSFYRPILSLFDFLEYPLFSLLAKQAQKSSQECQQFCGLAYRQGSILESCQGGNRYDFSSDMNASFSLQSPFGLLDKIVYTDTVVCVKRKNKAAYYDLHVPGHENYLANGFWNHNTGLGKTAMGLEFARQVTHRTTGRFLIIAPLNIIGQTIDEAKKFYGDEIKIKVLESRAALKKWAVHGKCQLAITNPAKFIPRKGDAETISELQHLVGCWLDECFPPDTPIDVFSIDKSLKQKYIKNVKIGENIFNAAGVDHVKKICKRRINRAVQISVGGRRITSSENHPYFTMYGWRHAQDLRSGDYIMATSKAVRLVRNNIRANPQRPKMAKILRSILLSEMANEYSEIQGKSTHSRNSGQKGQKKIRVVQKGQPESIEGIRQNSQFESNVEPRNSQKNDSYENDKWNLETMERPKRRKRKGDNASTTDNGRSTIGKLANRICDIFRQKTRRISNLLQSRFGESGLKNCDRAGWRFSQSKEKNGQQEGQKTGFIRVDSVEILEPGHPELEKYRDASGDIYFYDIEATRHPSFSVNGLLVHNSSILKTGGGTIKWALIKSCRGIEYKLSTTATPAPNDTMEYASQGSFLEKLRSEGEILWTFFCRDKFGNWKVKDHAKNAFYRFMSGWSIYLRNPKNYGFADNLKDLPPPIVKEYKISPTEKQRELVRAIPDAAGQLALFGKGDDAKLTITDRSKYSQLAKGFMYEGPKRKPNRYPSFKPEFVINLIKRDLADGLQVLVWTVFDEESVIISEMLNGSGHSVSVLTGKMPKSKRPAIIDDFRRGKTDILISKASLLGYGLNFQNCGSMIYSGFDDSFERFYQSLRRGYRYGQMKSMRVHIPYIPELEGVVWKNIMKKQARFAYDTAVMERNYLEAMKGTLGE